MSQGSWGFTWRRNHREANWGGGSQGRRVEQEGADPEDSSSRQHPATVALVARSEGLQAQVVWDQPLRRPDAFPCRPSQLQRPGEQRLRKPDITTPRLGRGGAGRGHTWISGCFHPLLPAHHPLSHLRPKRRSNFSPRLHHFVFFFRMTHCFIGSLADQLLILNKLMRILKRNSPSIETGEPGNQLLPIFLLLHLFFAFFSSERNYSRS